MNFKSSKYSFDLFVNRFLANRIISAYVGDYEVGDEYGKEIVFSIYCLFYINLRWRPIKQLTVSERYLNNLIKDIFRDRLLAIVER